MESCLPSAGMLMALLRLMTDPLQWLLQSSANNTCCTNSMKPVSKLLRQPRFRVDSLQCTTLLTQNFSRDFKKPYGCLEPARSFYLQLQRCLSFSAVTGSFKMRQYFHLDEGYEITLLYTWNRDPEKSLLPT